MLCLHTKLFCLVCTVCIQNIRYVHNKYAARILNSMEYCDLKTFQVECISNRITCDSRTVPSTSSSSSSSTLSLTSLLSSLMVMAKRFDVAIERIYNILMKFSAKLGSGWLKSVKKLEHTNRLPLHYMNFLEMYTQTNLAVYWLYGFAMVIVFLWF